MSTFLKKRELRTNLREIGIRSARRSKGMRTSAQTKNVDSFFLCSRRKGRVCGHRCGQEGAFSAGKITCSLQIASLGKEKNTGGHGLRVWKGGGTRDQGEKNTTVSVEMGEWTDREMQDYPHSNLDPLIFVIKNLKGCESSGLCVAFHRCLACIEQAQSWGEHMWGFCLASTKEEERSKAVRLYVLCIFASQESVEESKLWLTFMRIYNNSCKRSD